MAEYRILPINKNYEISDEGDMISYCRNKPKELKQPILDGYRCVSINKKKYRVHQLMAMTFIGVKPTNKEVDHKDGNKLNNKIANLRYLTHGENVKNSYNTGNKKPYYKKGGIHPSNMRVDKIEKGNIINTFISMNEAMLKTGIDRSSIGKVCSGKANSAGGYFWKLKY